MQILRSRGLQFLLSFVLSFGLLVVLAPLSSAQETNGTIAQGFEADASEGKLVAGALVSFNTGKERSVELATTATVTRLAGVVDTTPLVAIETTSQDVPVVLTGTATALVSDINGPVKNGDKITVSPIAGVGMRATNNIEVVGTAQSALDTRGSTTTTVTDNKGKKHTVHIGRVPLQVGVSRYQAPGSDFVPPVIQKFANAVAGRQVSLIRILLAVVLVVAGVTTAAIMAYSSTRTAMQSLGRNPLASPVIRKGLYQAIAISAGIFIATLIAGYTILSI